MALQQASRRIPVCWFVVVVGWAVALVVPLGLAGCLVVPLGLAVALVVAVGWAMALIFLELFLSFGTQQRGSLVPLTTAHLLALLDHFGFEFTKW